MYRIPVAKSMHYMPAVKSKYCIPIVNGMNGVLGHSSALVTLYWAGDNLG